MSLLLFVALAATTPDPQAPDAKAEKKICRVDVATGSMMPKRTCHTKAEWQQIDAVNQQAVEQSHSRVGSDGAIRP